MDKIITSNGKDKIQIKENGEKLVSLAKITERVIVRPHYFQIGIPGSINDCYLREGAASRLLKASEQLPNAHFFVVFDGWRPYQVQLELYKTVKEGLRKKGLTEEQIKRELSNYVDKPSKDPLKPSNHLTGGSVDLSIATEKGLLNMGTSFDEFTVKSRTNTYEGLTNLTEEERLIRDNRRLLKDTMERSGFSNFKEEWWHYDFGNQNWAQSTGNLAFYSGIMISERV